MSKETKSAGIKWLREVEEHDYAAAESFLLLLFGKKEVRKMISELRSTKITQFRAKDIFRASGLSLLGISNFHVESDRRKIKRGTGLSALLLVRDAQNGKVVIADGYHRLCAVYGFDEDAWIKCKII